MYNRVIYELTRKRTEEFNDEDKRIVKEELDRYRRSRIPIYPYIYRREIYFRIVFRNRSLRGFDTFEKAEDIYRRLAFGETELDDAKAEIKVKRKVLLVTLKDGYRILMKKHEAAYQNGELKYSSYITFCRFSKTNRWRRSQEGILLILSITSGRKRNPTKPIRTERQRNSLLVCSTRY